MTIYDIAKEAGVSVATVSKVLNNYSTVSEKTRQKVLAVMENNHYSPNQTARNLSNGVSHSIAFVVPDIENPFFSRILHAVTRSTRELNKSVFMYGTEEDVETEHSVLDEILAQNVAGLLITPVSDRDAGTTERLEKLRSMGIPVVLIDRDIEAVSFDAVLSDDRRGTIEAINCLLEAGHRKIGIITGRPTSRPGYERMRGYELALEAAGIEVRKDYMVAGNFVEEDSYKAMQELMELPDPPTAVFSSNNMTTLGCLHYLNDHKLKVGEDVALVGFDDIPELLYSGLRLTVVDRELYQMGEEAVRILCSQLESLEGVAAIHHRSVIGTKLIKRGSEYPKRETKQ